MYAGTAVVGVEDCSGLDVDDGPLRDLADPVDAEVFPATPAVVARTR